jgi:electron transport complex protein RnfB
VISVASILAVLPQTQCQRCGFQDCAAYAQAIATQEAPINQCPPGGQEGMRLLAVLTGQPDQALNPAHGLEGPRHLAYIDEDWCIGCTLCIEVCPVDAIIGTHKRMHTVIENLCTGCELCLPVCPVDCIEWENVSGHRTAWAAWTAEQASMASDRYAARQARLSLVQQPAEENMPSAKISRVEQALAIAKAKAAEKQAPKG